MRAGEVLGLLAGLGALNALRGGRDGAGPRFTGLLDMIDGGGAGRSGDRFEGGGLLSALGNLFAKPYEAQDRVERIAATTRSGNDGMTLRPRARPEMVFGNTPVGSMPAARPMMFGDTPVGSMPAASSDMMFGDTPVGSMPAAATQMVRPEGPAAGMPRALPSMVRPEGPAAGMPAAPTQMVRPEGPAAGMPQAPVQRYADPTQDPLFMQFMARQVDPQTFEMLYTGRGGQDRLDRQYNAYLSMMMAKEGRG